MRHKIEKLINTDITLKKVNHEYTLKSNPGMSFYCCSDLVSDQFRPFEAEKIARFLVYKTRKYANYTVESLLAEWKGAKDEGTRVHDELDNYIRNGRSVTASKAVPGKEWMDNTARDFGDTVYSEVIVYSEELKLAGTIEIKKLDKAAVAHLESDGATFTTKAADGTAHEVRIVASGVELTTTSK